LPPVFRFSLFVKPFSRSHGNKFAVPAFQVNSPDVFRHHPVLVKEGIKGFAIWGDEQANQNAVYKPSKGFLAVNFTLLAQAGDQVLKLPAGQTGSGKDADVFRHVFPS
jgi:hypothetical protein